MRVELRGDKELERKLKALGAAAARVVEAATVDGAKVLENAADQKAPGPHVIHEVVESTPGYAKVAIGPDKEHWYYMFFETGASSHEITPGVKGALMFVKEGETIIRVIVTHPGMAASPFLRPALDGSGDKVVKTMGGRFMRELEGG